MSKLSISTAEKEQIAATSPSAPAEKVRPSSALEIAVANRSKETITKEKIVALDDTSITLLKTVSQEDVEAIVEALKAIKITDQALAKKDAPIGYVKSRQNDQGIKIWFSKGTPIASLDNPQIAKILRGYDIITMDTLIGAVKEDLTIAARELWSSVKENITPEVANLPAVDSLKKVATGTSSDVGDRVAIKKAVQAHAQDFDGLDKAAVEHFKQRVNSGNSAVIPNITRQNSQSSGNGKSSSTKTSVNSDFLNDRSYESEEAAEKAESAESPKKSTSRFNDSTSHAASCSTEEKQEVSSHFSSKHSSRKLGSDKQEKTWAEKENERAKSPKVETPTKEIGRFQRLKIRLHIADSGSKSSLGL